MSQPQHQKEAPQQQQTPPAQPAPASASAPASTIPPQTPTPPAPYLPLPAPSDIPNQTQPQQRTTQVQVNGQAISLDHLGPTVINQDGTLSRIANWEELTEREQINTLRVLGKRNQLRLASLRGASSGDDNDKSTTTTAQ